MKSAITVVGGPSTVARRRTTGPPGPPPALSASTAVHAAMVIETNAQAALVTQAFCGTSRSRERDLEPNDGTVCVDREDLAVRAEPRRECERAFRRLCDQMV